MFAPLKKWFSRSALPRHPGCGSRQRSFRPALEALEDRQLLSAFPAVSTLVGNEDIALYRDGTLRRLFGTNDFFHQRVDSNVVSLSVGTDQNGSGMAAYVKADGTAHEWSDTVGGIALSNPALGITNNVKSVAAGQGGFVYVLLTSSHLFEFNGRSNSWSSLGGNVASVTAGSDAYGATMADVILMDGTAWEWSYDHPWDPNHGFYRQLTNPSLGITNNIQAVSADQNGVSFVLLNSGHLFEFVEGSNTWWNLGGGVASVTAGTNYAGGPMADVILMDGTAWEMSNTHPWDPNHGFYRQLVNAGAGITNNIRSVGAGQNDISDVVLNDGTLWQYNDQTRQWTWLDTGVA